jgi:hypothetical protein
MLTRKVQIVAVGAVLLCTLLAARISRAADPVAERRREAAYYECCYGPNGYLHHFNGCRPCTARDRECDEECHRCCCGLSCYPCNHGCCSCFSPGGRPPSKFLDICLYRIAFPISPWYSDPRDGLLYPAYGSKSPTCNPATY